MTTPDRFGIATSQGVRRRVHAAITSVKDPEYPDISIVDLGLLASFDVEGGVVHVGLVPTFSGCPALEMIAADVRIAVETLDGIQQCLVTWLPRPAWTTRRMSSAAVEKLAVDYTVVVRGRGDQLRCPVCRSGNVIDQSMAGPTRCRAIAWCVDCRNVVEAMRK